MVIPKELAKELQDFQTFGALCAKKNCVYSASVRCEKYRNGSSYLGEVGSLFRSEKVCVWRRDHAKFAQKFREKNAKRQEFRHAARRIKMRALGQRVLQHSCNVAAALSEVERSLRFEKVRIRRRDHAKCVQN